VTIVKGARSEFEIPDIVETVRELAARAASAPASGLEQAARQVIAAFSSSDQRIKNLEDDGRWYTSAEVDALCALRAALSQSAAPPPHSSRVDENGTIHDSRCSCDECRAATPAPAATRDVVVRDLPQFGLQSGYVASPEPPRPDLQAVAEAVIQMLLQHTRLGLSNIPKTELVKMVKEELERTVGR
jgi:hypothetical protein